MSNRSLLLAGFNWTNDQQVVIDARSLSLYRNEDGLNQETSFDVLQIIEGEKEYSIELKDWEYSSWNGLFDFCDSCELSYIEILKTFRSVGYSGERSLEHMQKECFVIKTYDESLTNIECEDALFDFLDEIGEFKNMDEKHKSYLDLEKILQDWQLNNLPVLEIDTNTFAILYRDSNSKLSL